MKGNIGILMVIAVMCPPCQQAWGIPVIDPSKADAKVAGVESVAERLEGLSPFAAEATYSVALPMLEDDVVYSLKLASEEADGDRLLGMDYLIRWSLPPKEGGEPSEGFLAYFDGHHYRYRDNRLQEYHYDWDSIPFLSSNGGVQSNGQFVDLLPGSIARELRMMLSSEDYTVDFEPKAVADGRDVSVVTAIHNVRGFVGRNYRLTVDAESGRPLSIDNEYNPGQISEQGVSVKYDYGSAPELAAVKSEEELMAIYPEVFEKFRENNYRIENLRGLPLPGFSLPTLTGERYSRNRGEKFKSPVVLAIIDPQVASAGETVKILQQVVATMPREITLLLAFTGNNIDQIEELTGMERVGETHLMSAKSLARDCGTSVYPTVLVVEPSGIVANVILGFNNSLGEDVIQSLALIK